MAQNRRFMNESYAREDNQLQRMVADATAAGISPVAALGASGAYSQTANYQPETSGDLIGAGLADVFGERAELENALLEAQVDATRAEAAASVMEARSRSATGAVRAAVQDVASDSIFADGAPTIVWPEVEGINLGKAPVLPNSLWQEGLIGNEAVLVSEGPFRGVYPRGFVGQEDIEQLLGDVPGFFQGIDTWLRYGDTTAWLRGGDIWQRLDRAIGPTGGYRSPVGVDGHYLTIQPDIPAR